MHTQTGTNWIRLLNFVALVPLTVVLVTSYASAAATFSLSGNWSNTINPNGPWSYNQGTTPLPLVSVWNGAGSGLPGCNQPAWAPSNNAGDFLPALMMPNSCTAGDLGTDPHNGKPNVMPGDIVTHTVDSTNGNPSLGVATFHFTVPTGDPGTYQISGFVWDADLQYGTARPQGWKLLVNGVQKATGSLSGAVSRSQAQKFNIVANLAGGNTVDLQVFETGGSGFFVGVNMTLTPICVLTDVLTYNATSGTLTMKFTLGTPVAATWNGWITVGNDIQQLWSQSQASTGLPISEIKTDTLAKSGEVGVLSTLTVASTGITCSSWQTVATGP